MLEPRFREAGGRTSSLPARGHGSLRPRPLRRADSQAAIRQRHRATKEHDQRPDPDQAHKRVEIDPDAEEGDEVQVDVTPSDFGRIAAQAAKQVITQRLREAERNLILEEFISKNIVFNEK